jgi:RNA polymerase sigma factor (sigma-70 family)
MTDDILSLIQGCLSNDRKSWNTLRQDAGSVVLNILRGRHSSLSSADHDDIVQNIFIKLSSNGLRDFRGTTKYEFLNYLGIIAKREAINHIRQHARHENTVSLDQPLSNDDDCHTTLLDTLADQNLRPDTIAELNNLFSTSLAQLSIRDKQILIYKVEGYKDREIAELLAIPMNTVASAYNRIKELLRKTLAMAILIILFGRNLSGASSL